MGQIRLTPEEIKAVESNWFKTPVEERVDPETLIAKAQLKKVVDIIREKQAYTAIVSETGNEIPFFNPIDWEEIWQALLKEIE